MLSSTTIHFTRTSTIPYRKYGTRALLMRRRAPVYCMSSTRLRSRAMRGATDNPPYTGIPRYEYEYKYQYPGPVLDSVITGGATTITAI